MYRIGQAEIDAVARVINSRELFKINDGLRETEKCEAKMRDIFDVKRVLLMTSGKGALISALIGMGIGPGDEVIVPGYTYIATAIAVLAVGAIPVIAEIDRTLTIDPEDIERKLTDRTKAIIPVHIQGFPCNMDAIMKIAENNSLAVLEDACQADGGSYRGRRLGAIGDAGALSFNQFKIISSGEGGALLTNNDTLFERALIYQDSSAVAFFGNQLDGITEPLFAGTEFRTNEIASAILNEQLNRLEGILDDLRENKSRLAAALEPYFTIAPSNDSDGDCGTTLTLTFDTAEQAEAFACKAPNGVTLPINTGKHIYCHWTPIIEKRGAFNPLMDPFKMEANKGHIPDYSVDMCPKTLEYLSRAAYIGISPDWTQQDIAEQAEYYIRGIK